MSEDLEGVTTIQIQKTTRKRLKYYVGKHGDDYDIILNDLMDFKDGHEEH